MPPRSAMRRAIDISIVRAGDRLASTPSREKPARRLWTYVTSPRRVRSRFGNSRSSKKSRRNSSRDSTKLKLSRDSPSPGSLPGPPSSPPSGRSIVSPGRYSRLPGSTKSRLPVLRSWLRCGSFNPRPGIEIRLPLPTSAMPRFSISSSTARLISSLKRRMKRSRLTALRPGGSPRRSTTRMKRLEAERSDTGSSQRLLHHDWVDFLKCMYQSTSRRTCFSV